MSTEYLDLTQYELSTPVNYTQLYNNDMLKIDTNAKKTANNIVSLSSDVVQIHLDLLDATSQLQSVANQVMELQEIMGNIGDRVDMIQSRTERLFFYSVEKNVAVNDTLSYNFDSIQLPAFIYLDSGYMIHYKFVSYTRLGIETLAEFTSPLQREITVGVNNSALVAISTYLMSGILHMETYRYIVNRLVIATDDNNVLHSAIDLGSECHKYEISTSGIIDRPESIHLAGKIIFSFEIFK